MRLYTTEYTPGSEYFKIAVIGAKNNGFDFIRSTKTNEITDVDGNSIPAKIQLEILSKVFGTHLTAEHFSDEMKQFIDDEPETDTDTDEYCVEYHNLHLLDTMINNTLKLERDMTNPTAEVLIKLAQLKLLLTQKQ